MSNLVAGWVTEIVLYSLRTTPNKEKNILKKGRKFEKKL
jgi:hypothetical protein